MRNRRSRGNPTGTCRCGRRSESVRATCSGTAHSWYTAAVAQEATEFKRIRPGTSRACHPTDPIPAMTYTAGACTWKTSFGERPDCGGDVVVPRSLRAQHRPVVSRVLHRLGDASAHAAAGLIAVVAVLGWILYGAIIGFPDWWETAMYVTSSAITLVMVFAIQHTQSRQQMATQRKLDELVRSMPDADNRLIAAESASDEELNALGQLNATDRRSGRAGPAMTPTSRSAPTCHVTPRPADLGGDSLPKSEPSGGPSWAFATRADREAGACGCSVSVPRRSGTEGRSLCAAQ